MKYDPCNNNAEYNYRLLVVYQDGQTTTSEYYLKDTALMVFNSIRRLSRVTYAELLDMKTGSTAAEIHRAYQFRQNNYHK